MLSIYLEDCGPRMADQPKLERCIGRLNDYWGDKMLAQVTAAECRSYVKKRGKIGGAILRRCGLRSIIMQKRTFTMDTFG